MDTTDLKNDKVENTDSTQDSTPANEAVKNEVINTENSVDSSDSKEKAEIASDEKIAIEAKEDIAPVITEETKEDVSKEEIKQENTETIVSEEANEEVEVTTEDSKIEETVEETKLTEEVEEVKTSDEVEKSPAKEEIKSEEISDKAEEKSKEDTEIDYDTLSMEELAATLTELVSTDKIESIKTAVGSIKSNFIKKIKQIKQDHYDKHISNGGTEDDYKTIKFEYEDVYKSAFSIYKEKRKIYIEQLEKTKVENLKKKNELLENLRKMINSEENLNVVYKEFQKLQDDWREIGLIPQGEVKNLWDNYHFLVDKFFDKVRINKELMMMGLNKNLNEKIILCEKAEELLLDSSINKSFLQLQEYHTKWKEIGPVPNDKNDEIWERFRNASDKINERRQKHYEEMHEEQKHNYLLKTALCEKIENLTDLIPDDLNQWTKITDEVNAIFAEWKTIGPTPKKHNEEIWKRFKTTMNNFFNEKKNFFGKIKDEQMNNYQFKLDLVAQANSIKDSQEWKDTTHTLINLQKKWKTIGTVPRKYSNAVWKDFRAACDHFFNAKDEFFKNINITEKENKALKLELIEKFEKQEFTDDSKASLDIIKQYQRDWIKIGRVPMKDKSNLQSKFQKVVDKHLNSLNIDSFEFENAAFKTRLDSAENPRDAERMIQKEVNFLKSKIETIVKDVTLWETNISFFSNSKNADLLKADFEKKINKAKNDIKTFKTKLRQFDKMKRSL